MATSESLVTLDVREILKTGGEPLGEIMHAVGSLAPGQGLRLLATFKPMPLFGVMQQQGFTHSEREIGGGDWEVIFSPAGTETASVPAGASAAPAQRPSAPAATLDVRGLMPPEPMQRALEAVEALEPGQSLQLLTDREPTLLYQELSRRQHTYVSERAGNDYRTTVLRGDTAGERR